MWVGSLLHFFGSIPAGGFVGAGVVVGAGGGFVEVGGGLVGGATLVAVGVSGPAEVAVGPGTWVAAAGVAVGPIG